MTQSQVYWYSSEYFQFQVNFSLKNIVVRFYVISEKKIDLYCFFLNSCQNDIKIRKFPKNGIDLMLVSSNVFVPIFHDSFILTLLLFNVTILARKFYGLVINNYFKKILRYSNEYKWYKYLRIWAYSGTST